MLEVFLFSVLIRYRYLEQGPLKVSERFGNLDRVKIGKPLESCMSTIQMLCGSVVVSISVT